MKERVEAWQRDHRERGPRSSKGPRSSRELVRISMMGWVPSSELRGMHGAAEGRSFRPQHAGVSKACCAIWQCIFSWVDRLLLSDPGGGAGFCLAGRLHGMQLANAVPGAAQWFWRSLLQQGPVHTMGCLLPAQGLLRRHQKGPKGVPTSGVCTCRRSASLSSAMRQSDFVVSDMPEQQESGHKMSFGRKAMSSLMPKLSR